MNLAVQAILKALQKSAAYFRDSMAKENQPIDEKTEAYLQALDSDPIEACRVSITACRPSGQRREVLRKIIIDAQIPVLFHRQYESLQDIASVLSVVHSAQELLSAEKTLTLSLAFPVYESVIQAWLDLGPKIPELATPVGAGIGKIHECVNRTKSARVQTLEMFINPGIKFDFMNRCWPAYDRDRAYKVVRETMLKFQRQRYAQCEMRVVSSRTGEGNGDVGA
ncbi:unnamed protein product [Rhizoctonia solani]|uniref:Uncharacterized protein n=1 Tax=Rhizoctonia solani TaxID=456999 RepID=A0A8H2WB67_9AGAM|nr:unnamed protein product [Rhizoctonia solani]